MASWRPGVFALRENGKSLSDAYLLCADVSLGQCRPGALGEALGRRYNQSAGQRRLLQVQGIYQIGAYVAGQDGVRCARR